jgi:hypothetical protein
LEGKFATHNLPKAEKVKINELRSFTTILWYNSCKNS